MNITPYQRAVLQALDIPLFTQEGVGESFVIEDESQASSKSTAILQAKESKFLPVATNNVLYQNLTHAFGEQFQATFSWVQGTDKQTIEFADNQLVTPEVESLDGEQKKQIWSMLGQYFDAKSWS